MSVSEKLKLMIGRCILAAVSDKAKCQSLQITAFDGETHDRVERFQQFGFTAVPLPGAEGICLFVGGGRDHPVVVAVEDRRHRVTDLAPGESAQYNSSGHKLVLYHDRAELVTQKFVVKASEKVRFETPLVETTGQIRADQDITDKAGSGGKSMAAMREVYDGHTHKENNVTGGESQPPTQKAGGS
ncbi:phage baseplate assembly protein V [Crenobacter cavernae]|uniref:Phage baseplate assembly protein V n=1 Tax=Crenobacter cavernae TaxID=2290923 RepID=A0A345Y6R3_9NEIS|nr:phage baseplate assembly protein V [Crenobacter cavernae]AXK39615.1 phage baseplate assembly protein V [Crenobacter cavernae]